MPAVVINSQFAVSGQISHRAAYHWSQLDTKSFLIAAAFNILILIAFISSNFSSK
jgi:hypothetical protein